MRIKREGNYAVTATLTTLTSIQSNNKFLDKIHASYTDTNGCSYLDPPTKVVEERKKCSQLISKT